MKLIQLENIDWEKAETTTFEATVNFKDYDFKVKGEVRKVTKFSTAYTEFNCKIQNDLGSPNLTKGQKAKIYELIREKL